MLALLLNPIWVLRAFFLAASALILFINAVEPLRTRFLAYGSRLTPPASSSSKKDDDNGGSKSSSSSPITSLLDAAASIRVPHNYFAHFYSVALCSVLLWTHQLLTHGPLFAYLASRVPPTTPSMTAPQVAMMTVLLLAQCIRRLGESYAFARRSSSSRMWVVHYLLGLAFYFALSISVWIEGAPAIASIPRNTLITPSTQKLLTSPQTLTLSDLSALLSSLTPTSILTFLPKPTYTIIWLLPVVFVASGIQHDIHQHLSTLPPGPNYKQPTHPAFSALITPHYFFEVVIYVMWAFLGAPEGTWGVNWTLACATLFVAVNLGVTAQGTREWWRKRWGEEAVKGKWTMIPYLF